MIYSKLNLQLFADPNTLTTGTASLSAEMKTYYDMTLIDEASAELVHDQFGQKRPIPANGGKIIEFRKFAPLNKALTPLTEGVTPDGNSLSVSTITAEIAQYGDYITQSDILELTALDNTILEATKLLGKQAGLTMDTIVRNALMEGTNKMLCPKISNGTETAVSARSALDKTAILTVKALQKAAAILRGQNAPTIGGKYVGIIHPYNAYQLMRDPEWRNVREYQNATALYEGEIGEMAGIRFVQTTEAKVFGAKKLYGDISAVTCKTAINSSTTSVVINEAIPAATYETAIPCLVNGVANTIVSVSVASNVSTLTLGTAVSSLAEGAVIQTKGAASDGSAVFATLILGQGAYGVTEITGGGLQTIVKQKGSGEDPLNQRSSVGWKGIKTAKILIPQYMLRIESCVPDFQFTNEN